LSAPGLSRRSRGPFLPASRRPHGQGTSSDSSKVATRESTT
jgi:hypothetical protein